MPPINSTSVSTPYASQTDTNNSEFVYPGESRLSEVAQRLGVDANRLLKANPQIADPNNLLPGQEIKLPQAPPPVPMRDDGGEQLVKKNANLPRAPIGDPVAESAMKAKFAQQTVPADKPESTGEEEEKVSRPDPETQEWMDAQLKLDELGLPRTPPNITKEDFDKLSDKPEPKKGPGPPSVRQQTEDVLGLSSLGLGSIAAWGTAAGVAATGAAILAVPGAFLLGTGIAERAEQSKQAHDDAVKKMEAGMSYAAQQLVLQKFPQVKDHPLNERGKAQVEAVAKEWKEKNDKNMDTVLRVLNGHQGSISDDPVGFARAMLRGGSVDLANKLMQVYYDPRNWQK